MTEHNPDNTYSLDCRPSWSSFANRFGDESDCLAAFIALETAEVLAGVKPSTLLSIPDNSLRLAEKFRTCRNDMARMLAQSHSPRECVASFTHPVTPLFLHHN